MANASNGNTIYIDSTGSISNTLNVKVMSISITSTGASPRIVLQDSASTAVNKVDLRLTGEDQTGLMDYSAAPMHFPNGITIGTLNNAICTIIYRREGS